MTKMDVTASSSNQSLLIPKLCDDGSNGADYEPRAHMAMGTKGLLPHLEGRAIQPKPLVLVNGIPMGSTSVPVTNKQIEARDKKIEQYEQRESLTKYLITSSTSPCLSQQILDLATANDMWDTIKQDATTKSALM